MPMFSSKTPRDLNRDPEPMFTPVLGQRAEYADESLGWQYRPRPEFDHIQHNEPNPILVKFREIPADSRESWRTGFLAAAERVRFAAWTDAQADHARRVLSRLKDES